MTALKLDARQPLIAIVGAFNPAIFSPLWVAYHLHGYPKGAEVEMLEAVAEASGGLAQLTFIDGVALTVSETRLDAIVLSQEAPRLTALEKILTKLVEVLPHTPLRGLGCNLTFVDEDPSDELLAYFNSPEGVEGEYSVHARQFSAQLDFDGGVLNFNRAEDNGSVRFGFNYHHSLTEPEQYARVIPGLVQRSTEHATAFLASLYDLRNYEVIDYMQVSAREVAVVQVGQNSIVESNHSAVGASK